MGVTERYKKANGKCHMCGVNVGVRFHYCEKCARIRQYDRNLEQRLKNPNYYKEWYRKYGRKRYKNIRGLRIECKEK